MSRSPATLRRRVGACCSAVLAELLVQHSSKVHGAIRTADTAAVAAAAGGGRFGGGGHLERQPSVVTVAS